MTDLAHLTILFLIAQVLMDVEDHTGPHQRRIILTVASMEVVLLTLQLVPHRIRMGPTRRCAHPPILSVVLMGTAQSPPQLVLHNWSVLTAREQHLCNVPLVFVYLPSSNVLL